MIITEKFIYLHMPKTGGTFVTALLKQLWGVDQESSFFTKIKQKVIRRRAFVNINKHGVCYQIPSQYTHMPILGCVRNPYDRYVSQYTFNWWKNHPDDFRGLREHPRFPDLSFEDFVYLANEKWLDVGKFNTKLDPSVGWHTNAFITYYCRNPKDLLCYGENPTLTTARIRAAMGPETLLRTHRLNEDLYDYLLKQGYSASQLGFILASPKIMPREGGRSEDQKWEKYYTPVLKAFVRERERLLFSLFPEFDV